MSELSHHASQLMHAHRCQPAITPEPFVVAQNGVVMTQPFQHGSPLSDRERRVLDEISASLRRDEFAAEPPTTGTADTVWLPRIPASLSEEVLSAHRPAPQHRRKWQVLLVVIALVFILVLVGLAVYLSA